MADVGFRYALTGSYSLGANFENLVFLELMEKTPFYYIEDGAELDFVVGNEVFECKWGRSLTERQHALIKKLERRGYRVHLVEGWRWFYR